MTRGYAIIIMSIMCLVLKWFGVVNSNDKKNLAFIFSELLHIYLIFRGIYCGLTLENIIMIIGVNESVNESVNEGVISAAVNCSHMRPVNLTLLTLRCLQLKNCCYYAACF